MTGVDWWRLESDELGQVVATGNWMEGSGLLSLLISISFLFLFLPGAEYLPIWAKREDLTIFKDTARCCINNGLIPFQEPPSS